MDFGFIKWPGNWRKRIPSINLYLTSTFSMFVAVGAQAVALIIVARYLDRVQFGHISTISAAASIAAPWSQLGSAEAMRRLVGRDVSQYPSVLGHSLILIFGLGTIISVVAAVVISIFVHVSQSWATNLGIIALFAISNLIMYPWIVLTEQIFLAHQRYVSANLTSGGFGVLRALSAALACIVFGVNSLGAWAVWNAGVYCLGSVLCAFALRGFGAPRLRLLTEELPIGATFGVSGFLNTLRSNVDVLSLSANEPASVVGMYGAARRIVAFAVVASASFDRLVYSRFALAGQRGVPATAELAGRYLPYVLLITLGTVAAILVAADFVVGLLFGPSYAESAHLLRLLAFVVVFNGLQNLAFDALNAADQHRFQTKISSPVIILGSLAIVGCSWLGGVLGTVAGVYVAEVSFAAAIWAGLQFLAARGRRADAPATTTD